MPLASTYQDNISNLQPLNDYGIKISKIGFDATTAADKDLLYNSSWPSMQIVKVIPFDGTIYSFSHSLGFPPFALLLSPDNYFRAMINLPCDDTNVYVPTSESGAGTIIIYNLNLTIDVEYPYTTQTGGNITYNYDYGIKLAKINADIESNDMRDYILHSRCGSPLILAVKTEETVNESNSSIVQYTNHIGYETLNFGYVKVKNTNNMPGVSVVYTGINRYCSAPLQSQSYPQTYTNGVTTYVPFNVDIGGAVYDDGATVVVLRNPSIASTNSVVATY